MAIQHEYCTNIAPAIFAQKMLSWTSRSMVLHSDNINSVSNKLYH